MPYNLQLKCSFIVKGKSFLLSSTTAKRKILVHSSLISATGADFVEFVSYKAKMGTLKIFR